MEFTAPSADAAAPGVGGGGEAEVAQTAQNIVTPQRFDECPHGFSL